MIFFLASGIEEILFEEGRNWSAAWELMNMILDTMFPIRDLGAENGT